jgi:hypothetical protein
LDHAAPIPPGQSTNANKKTKKSSFFILLLSFQTTAMKAATLAIVLLFALTVSAEIFFSEEFKGL